MNNYFFEKDIDSRPVVNMDSSDLGVDFSFFSSDDAKNLKGEPETKKKSNKPKVAINGETLPDRVVPNTPAVSGTIVAETDYGRSYNETNNLIRGAIFQADELSAEIKQDIDAVRASKTIKNKYTYITNLTASASALISTKISAIKELNDTITQGHKLELDRMKALKLNEADGNDDMKMMDLYNAFVNTPIGAYTPSVPNIQDLTLGVNAQIDPVVKAVEMTAPMTGGAALTPEQNRMRMESNANIRIVVRYNQNTGQRAFDVVDASTGMSIPNYPRPDAFLLEDTTIDVHAGIARNRNINAVWPLLVEGSNTFITEY